MKLFRPKKKNVAAGNKGKDWIPTVFDQLQAQALAALPSHCTSLWHWERQDWTFHAKGLWVTSQNDQLAAAIVGSSNFGRRSWERDMESNLILVFPPRSTSSLLETTLMEEWKHLLGDSRHVQEPHNILASNAASLPLHVRLCYPFIQSFF